MHNQPNQEVVAIYSRKSRFTGKGESIGNQVDLCRGYIRTAFGGACAEGAMVFEDEGFSGGNLNRPGFQRMMAAARAGQFRAVVVYRLDRISRNIGDFSRLIEELGRLQIDFVSIRESFDTSSPMGRAMMYIASVFSQLERETIAERIRDNLRELAKTGRWLGGVTPTGYTSESVKTVTLEGKTKRVCQLKLIPEEGELVRTIYRLYRETDSLTRTESELLRRQVRTKNGRPFTRFSIKGILRNPVYLRADREAYRYFQDRQAELCSGPEAFDGVRGMLAYNRTRQQKGRAARELPPSQWIVSVGQHPGLIPGNIWVQVQESLDRNKAKGYRKPRSNQALLTGLLWCRCGSRMYPKLSRQRTPEGQPVYAYVCSLKEHSQRTLCRCTNVQGNQLDAAVLEQAGQLAADRDLFCRQLEKSRRWYGGRREDAAPQLDQLRRQQAEIQRKISSLTDALADFGDSAAAAHVKQRMEDLDAQSGELRARAEAWERLAARPALDPETFDQLRRQLSVLGESLAQMSLEQKRSALRALVQKVIWDGACAHLVFWGAEEAGPGYSPNSAPPVENAGAGG